MRRVLAAAACLVVLVAAVLAAGEMDLDYRVGTLDLQQEEWESVRVDVSFEKPSLLRSPRTASPSELSVVAFDASYDTLYAGSDTHVPIPDHKLGDREQVIIEVCGAFDDVTVCDQAGLAASPKRVLAEHDIEYPKQGNVGEGRYEFTFHVERQRFGAGEWEAIEDPAPIDTYLLAYVEDPAQGAVRVPLRQREGRFNLAQHANHSEFDFHLRSSLMNRDQVLVRFDVLAGLNAQTPRRIATVERPVRRMTREERADEVGYFAKQAAEQLLYEWLGVSEEQTASVYIDQWDFLEVMNRYQIDVEIRWRSGFLGLNDHQLFGRIEVQSDGTRVRFRQMDANRRVGRMWGREIDGDEVELSPLERPELDTEAPRVTREQEEDVPVDPTRHASRTPFTF